IAEGNFLASYVANCHEQNQSNRKQSSHNFSLITHYRASQRAAHRGLFDHLKLPQRIFFNCDAQSWSFIRQINVALLWLGFAVKDVPEELIAYLNIIDGEKFGKRRV